MVSLVSGRVLGLSGDTLVSSSILGLTLIACGTSAFPMLLNEQVSTPADEALWTHSLVSQRVLVLSNPLHAVRCTEQQRDEVNPV
jgi:hypothetical protein